MKDFYTVNFKDLIISAEDVQIFIDMEIEKAKKMGISAFKVLHGYGSHGKGGTICVNLRNYLFKLRDKHIIKDVFIGSEWAIQNERCFKLLSSSKDAVYDGDLGKQNPGITVVFL